MVRCSLLFTYLRGLECASGSPLVRAAGILYSKFCAAAALSMSIAFVVLTLVVGVPQPADVVQQQLAAAKECHVALQAKATIFHKIITVTALLFLN